MTKVIIEKDSTDSQDRYLAELQALPSQARKKLSREQKLLIQKLKNRRSAQKSRDQKKLFIAQLQERVAHLERENQRLSAVISGCGACSKKLDLAQAELQPEQEAERDFAQFDWERVSVGSRPQSFSKLILLIMVVLAMFGDLQVLESGESQHSAFFSKETPFGNNSVIRYTPYKKQDQCLLQHRQASWAALDNWLDLGQNRSKLQTGLAPPGSVRRRQDTVVCEGPKIIRGEGLRKRGFQISDIFELMLDGRQLREYGLVDNIWEGELRCEYQTYRILAEVKSLQVYSNFECFQ